MDYNKYDISEMYKPEEIVNSLLKYYYAVFILDYTNDCVIPIRLSDEVSKIPNHDIVKAFSALSWSCNLGDALKRIAQEKYYKGLFAFINRDSVVTAFNPEDEVQVLKYTFLHIDNSWKRAILTPLKMNGNMTERALLTIANVEVPPKQVDESNESKLQTKRYRDVFLDVVEHMYTGMIRVDIRTGQTVQLRSEGNHMVEYSHNKKWDELCKIALNMVHPEDKELFYNNCSMEAWAQINQNQNLQFEFRDSYGQEDGSYRWYSGAVHIVCEPEQKIALLYTVDITDKVNERDQLKESSERDELTFLYNRTHLDLMLETEYRDIHSCGVLFLDINDLKETNDLKGHKAGDELIYQGAESLRILQNDEVQVYRYGGDEFIVIAPNITQEYLEKLIDRWKAHLKWLEESNGISCSMAYGKAWNIAPCSVKELISLADAEMYKNKRKMKKEQEPDSSLEKRDLSRQRRYLLDVLSSEYDCIYELDLRNNHYQRLKSLFSDTDDNAPKEGSFNPYLIQILSGKVDERQINRALSAISAHNLLQHMDENHILRLQMKPTYIPNTVWNVKAQVVEMKDDYPIKVMILLKVETVQEQ